MSTSAISASRPSPAPELTVKKMMLNAGFIRASAGPSAPDHGACETRQPALEQRPRIILSQDRLRLPRRKIAVDRGVAKLGHQAEARALGGQARNIGVGIIEIAEQPRVRRTGEYAGRLPILRRQHHIVDAVDAQRALLHGTR